MVEIFVAKPELAQSKQRIFRTFVCQRIHPRDGVTKNAIGMNQSVDASLQRTLAPRFDLGGDRRAILAIKVSKVESLKKRGPTRVERIGVFTPALVVLLEQIEIQTGGK